MPYKYNVFTGEYDVVDSAEGLYPISEYVVDWRGTTEYTTIQSALDAAEAAGYNAGVYVRPGTYTEDLILYDGMDVIGAVGIADTGTFKIVGTHTPPTSGAVCIRNAYLESTTDVFNSAAAGTSSIILVDCAIAVTNGYTFNLPNWTGSFGAFDIGEVASTNDGWINNTAGATVFMTDVTIGAGSTNTMNVSGTTTMFNVNAQCPINFQSTGTANIRGCWITNGITTSDTAGVDISNTTIASGSTTAITHNSTTTMTTSDLTIDTSNATAIDGTGTIQLGSVTFLDSYGVAGTVTQQLDAVEQTGYIFAENIQDAKLTGFVSWSGAGSYYTVSGTDFTLDRPGFGYIKSKPIAWAGAQTVSSLSAGNTHFIYIDNTGTIGSTTSFSESLYKDNIVLFQVLVDSDTPANLFVVKENHPYDMPVETSVTLHKTIGSVISNINNGANIVAGTNPDEIGISGDDFFEDHGLETEILDTAGASVTWNIFYTNGAGKWIDYTTSATFPSVYNNAGTPTALGASKYGVFTLYVTKDDLESTNALFVAVMDDTEYNNQSAADTAIENGSVAIATNELFDIEVARLGYIVYEQSSGTISEIIVDKATARGGSVTVSGATTASGVTTNTANFDHWLSASDTTVQTALDTLDEVGAGVTPEHGVVLAGASNALNTTAVGATGTVLIGNTGADPSFSATPSVTRITISNAPTNATDGVNKTYVDAISSGFDHKDTTEATTTANLNATYDNGVAGVGATLTNNGTLAAFSIDGQSPTAGQRVLIKDQTNAFENGIYTVTTVGDGVTAWVLTRATDYDEVAEMDNGSLVPVKSGTQYANTTWMQVTTVATIGTDDIDYNKYQGTPISTVENSVLIGDVYDGVKNQALTDGQLLIGNTGNAPTAATLASADGTVVITNGSGSIDLSAANAEKVVSVTSLDNTDSPYTVLVADYHLSCDVSGGALTIDLPNAPSTGTIYSVKDAGGDAATNNITVTTAGGVVTIDGATTFVINTNYQAIKVVFNGTSYEVI